MLTKALSILTALGLVSSLILGNLWLGSRDEVVALELDKKGLESQLIDASKQYQELESRKSIDDEVKVEQEEKLVVIEEKETKQIAAIDNIKKECTGEVNEKDTVAGIDDSLPPELTSVLSEVHL